MQSTPIWMPACSAGSPSIRLSFAWPSTLVRAAARIWTLGQTVVLFLLVQCILPASAASAECIAELQAEIVDRYVATYHNHWGEMSERAVIEARMTALAKDARIILKKCDNPPCRFSVTVGRELPPEPWGGPYLSLNAVAIPAVLEFATAGPSYALG
jgi:hypothetical protein